MEPREKQNVKQKFDFVDANPSGSSGTRRGSESMDASGFTDIPPIPRRRGSSFVRTTLKPNSKFYSMDGEKRGKVLIFNHVNFEDVIYEERKGTEKDVNRLYYTTLPQLGFKQEDIVVMDNFSYSEMLGVVNDLKSDKDLEASDCLMVFILTHGEEGDVLIARDGSYHLYDFMDSFTPTALASMAGKPKMFVVQACRGTKFDRGVQLLAMDIAMDHVDSQATAFSYPEYADFMIVMSSHHGHTSFRNENGSWLIQELCNVIESCDLERSSILDILTDTNDAVSKRASSSTNIEKHNKKQISSFYSTMTKRLYFKSSVTPNMSPAFQRIESTTDDSEQKSGS